MLRYYFQRFIWLVIGCFLTTFAQAQTVSGTVRAQRSGQPVAYVNIGIKGKNVGTTADETGAFSLVIPPALAHDTLTLLAIGYAPRAIPIQPLLTQPQLIQLVEKELALPEVVVRGRTEKIRKIGTTSHNPLLWGMVKSKDTQDSNEFAKFIALDNKPSQLLAAHIFLRRPLVDTITLRLNFCRAVQGVPAERIIEQTILVRTASLNGWLTIDLSKYNLNLTTDFFLSFEFLPHKQTVPRPFYYGAQLGGAALIRTSSLGTWKREPGASLAAYVTVRQ